MPEVTITMSVRQAKLAHQALEAQKRLATEGGQVWVWHGHNATLRTTLESAINQAERPPATMRCPECGEARATTLTGLMLDDHTC